uniref:Anterior gradient protein 3-like n=1 Tax=Dromaius novaehollandiae TaxID=8790 RepID=A0A8C4IYF5_DRONO
NMHSYPLLCSFLLFNGLMVAAQRKVQEPLSTGWGDDIEWVQTYEEGLARSRQSSDADFPTPPPPTHTPKNIFLFLLALKKAFASNTEIQQMAQEDFIMLNLVHSSSDDNMAPDGHYVPRILFVDPSMTVRADITGKYGNRMYTYEPQDISACNNLKFIQSKYG